MILLLDANVIVSDAELSGKVWPEISRAIEEGVLRVFVPSIVVAEVTASVRAARLKSEPQMPSRVPEPVRVAIDAGREAVQQWADGYDAASILEKAGFEILPTPDVPHDVVAQRAIDRRRPFNDNGGGYRDTLHWFSLLEAAKANPTDEIVLVSNDKMFANDGQLHAGLVDEARVELGGRTVELHTRIVAVPIPGKFAAEAVPLTLDHEGVSDLLEALFSNGNLHVTDLWATAGLFMPEDAELSKPMDVQVSRGSERPLVAGGAQRTVEMTLSANVDFDWSDSPGGDQARERIRLVVRYTLDAAGSLESIDEVDSAIAWPPKVTSSPDGQVSQIGFDRASFSLVDQMLRSVRESQPKPDLSGFQAVFSNSPEIFKPFTNPIPAIMPTWPDVFGTKDLFRNIFSIPYFKGAAAPLSPETQRAIEDASEAATHLVNAALKKRNHSVVPDAGGQPPVPLDEGATDDVVKGDEGPDSSADKN